MTRWLPDTCSRCGGHTVYAVWVGDYDIADCMECSGGVVWVSERDRIAAWPGGPFLGSAPGRFARVFDAHPDKLVTTPRTLEGDSP